MYLYSIKQALFNLQFFWPITLRTYGSYSVTHICLGHHSLEERSTNGITLLDYVGKVRHLALSNTDYDEIQINYRHVGEKIFQFLNRFLFRWTTGLDELDLSSTSPETR
jgi:hypothetical protein